LQYVISPIETAYKNMIPYRGITVQPFIDKEVASHEALVQDIGISRVVFLLTACLSRIE
jgi:hypothetical protein